MVRIALVTLLFTLSAAAQTFEQTAILRLSESSMSARATAMGGASDPLGDDSADFASNPALLSSIRQPLFSLSAVQTSYDVQRLRFEDDAVLVVRDPQNARSLGHVSAVIPMRGLVVGLYARNQPVLRDGHLDYALSTADYVPACREEGRPCLYAQYLGSNAFERREQRYGFAAAFERGAFSFGAGAELQDLDEHSEVARGAVPASYGFERLVRRTSGRKLVPNAGLRWRVSPRIAIAAAYNGAASRERTEDVCIVDTAVTLDCTSRFVMLNRSEVNGVDAYRASIAVAPVQQLVVTAEAVRRNYGNLPDEQPDFFGDAYDISYGDTTELHAGAEYRLGGVSLRAGWWREPSKIDSPDRIGFQGEDVEHRTYGVGVDLGATRVDVAYDDADVPALRRAVVGISYGFRR
jgi:hypothetical protein